MMDDSPVGRMWYIPHHGVYHPNKPRKIRVIFDCSSQFAVKSLNQELLVGPDPSTNSIVGVLTRFRQGQVAYMADIESIYYQVRVPEYQHIHQVLLEEISEQRGRVLIFCNVCTRIW